MFKRPNSLFAKWKNPLSHTLPRLYTCACVCIHWCVGLGYNAHKCAKVLGSSLACLPCFSQVHCFWSSFVEVIPALTPKTRLNFLSLNFPPVKARSPCCLSVPALALVVSSGLLCSDNKITHHLFKAESGFRGPTETLSAHFPTTYPSTRISKPDRIIWRALRRHCRSPLHLALSLPSYL